LGSNWDDFTKESVARGNYLEAQDARGPVCGLWVFLDDILGRFALVKQVMVQDVELVTLRMQKENGNVCRMLNVALHRCKLPLGARQRRRN